MIFVLKKLFRGGLPRHSFALAASSGNSRDFCRSFCARKKLILRKILPGQFGCRRTELFWQANKKKNNDSKKNGFTLVELTTVVAMIGIVSVLMIANYHRGGQQLALDSDANLLAQNLRKMQDWSLAAHEIGGEPIHGYGIYATAGQTGQNKYVLFLDDGEGGGATKGNGIYDDTKDSIEETVFLDSDVEVASANPAPATVVYLVPDPATKINGDPNTMEQKIVLRLKGTSVSRTITANKAGLIYVE